MRFLYKLCLPVTDEGDYEVDEETLRLMALRADEVDLCLGPNKENQAPLGVYDEQVARVLAKYDPHAPGLEDFFNRDSWHTVMDFVVRGGAKEGLEKFMRTRPDEVYRKVYGEKRDRTRAHFRWLLKPEFPWTETAVYKEHRTVSR